MAGTTTTAGTSSNSLHERGREWHHLPCPYDVHGPGQPDTATRHRRREQLRDLRRRSSPGGGAPRSTAWAPCRLSRRCRPTARGAGLRVLSRSDRGRPRRQDRRDPALGSGRHEPADGRLPEILIPTTTGWTPTTFTYTASQGTTNTNHASCNSLTSPSGGTNIVRTNVGNTNGTFNGCWLVLRSTIPADYTAEQQGWWRIRYRMRNSGNRESARRTT